MAFRAIRFDLLQFRFAVPYLAHGHSAIEFNGFRTAREGIKGSLDVGMPRAKVEIEIVLPIAHRAGRSLRLGCPEPRKEKSNACEKSQTYCNFPPMSHVPLQNICHWVSPCRKVPCSWLLQQGHIAEKSVGHFLKDRDAVPGLLTLTVVAAVAGLALLVISSGSKGLAAEAVHTIEPRMISELKPTAIIHLGKTADWVAITPDAVWVGSTGPFAVNRIDPKTNTWTATVKLGGEPCAGLATGFGSLWVPLCGKYPRLAKVNLASNELSVFDVGPAAAEGGVTTSPDSVWLVIDKHGSLARIDPTDGGVRQTIRVPAGSYNPLYAEGQIWVTRADGSEITSVDAVTGAVLSTTPTGPGPRFLTAGAGAVWTLNQGDGSLTRVDARTRQVTHTTPLGIPGKGGDISFGGGMIWTTVWKVPLSMVDGASAALLCRWLGPGGDSLGIGHGAIWLTDYHAGTISRIELKDALMHCKGRGFTDRP